MHSISLRYIIYLWVLISSVVVTSYSGTAEYANSYVSAVTEYKAFLGKDPTREDILILLKSDLDAKNEALIALAMKVAVLSDYISDDELKAFSKIHNKSGMISYNYAYMVFSSPSRVEVLATSAKQVLVDSLDSSTSTSYLLLTARLLLERGHKEGLKIFYIKSAWNSEGNRNILRTRESVIAMAQKYEGVEFNGSIFNLESVKNALSIDVR